MIELSKQPPVIRCFASKSTWIEGDAIRQLEQAAGLTGVKIAVGLPDLHPGMGIPVGAAFLVDNRIYPHLIGSDAGCGVGLWQTKLKTNKIKRDRWSKKLNGLEFPWEGDTYAWLQHHNCTAIDFIDAHGTIGGGNHFAELQRIERIHDADRFDELELTKNRLFLMVHSGSRGLGQRILREHTDRFKASGLPDDSDEAQAYLQQHDQALQWAESSRALIAHRFAEQLGTTCDLVLDLCHNSVTRIDTQELAGWLHRKGAMPSDRPVGVVPGSRGDLSYLIEAVGDQPQNLWSLAHGAGRKWNRASCKGRIREKFNAAGLSHTPLGSLVICDDAALLYEEAPQAYKNIESIINEMIADGLINVIATLRPLITYKVRKNR